MQPGRRAWEGERWLAGLLKVSKSSVAVRFRFAHLSEPLPSWNESRTSC